MSGGPATDPATTIDMDNQQEEFYPCVGICMADPDSGYCLGCGRPPLAAPGIVAEITAPTLAHPAHRGDPETPE